MMNSYPEGYEPRLFLAKACADLGAEVDYECFQATVTGDDPMPQDVPGFTVNGCAVIYLLDNRMPALQWQNDAAKEIKRSGKVVVCCAQKKDAEIHGFHWLPLAVTPAYEPITIGSPDVIVEAAFSPYDNPEFDFAFVGYLNDLPRKSLMDRVLDNFRGNIQSGVFGDEAVIAYRKAKIGLNIPAFFGTTFAYDVNMRVFEIARIGRPLVSATVPGMEELGFIHGQNYLGYTNAYGLIDCILLLLAVPTLREDLARESGKLVTEQHLYKHRAQRLLEIIDAE